MRDFMKKRADQSSNSDSGDSSATAETTEKPVAGKVWRYLNLWREDRTHYVPGFGMMDRDSYNSIVLGGDSSPFQ